MDAVYLVREEHSLSIMVTFAMTPLLPLLRNIKGCKWNSATGSLIFPDSVASLYAIRRIIINHPLIEIGLGGTLAAYHLPAWVDDNAPSVKKSFPGVLLQNQKPNSVEIKSISSPLPARASPPTVVTATIRPPGPTPSQPPGPTPSQPPGPILSQSPSSQAEPLENLAVSPPVIASINTHVEDRDILHIEPPVDQLGEDWAQRLDRELRSRKYSERTIKLYQYHNRAFCGFFARPPEMIQSNDAVCYLAHLEQTLNASAATLNVIISALRFFYKNVVGHDIILDRTRPKSDRRLPLILSREETEAIISREKNPKHRLLLMLVYSSGLRVSEIVRLLWKDLDLDRRTLFIRAGKGRKDRYSILSERVAQYLAEYLKMNEPASWLFPGMLDDKHLTIRSAQKVFEKAARNAGITKAVSIHSLRHSFATHLIEMGTDIKYIQELLGHVSVHTTERYIHVAKRAILNIRSPFDAK